MKAAFTSVCVGLILIAWCVPLAIAEEDEDEQEVQLKDCPEAVQKTIKTQTEGGKILEIEKETDDGKVVYECEYTKDKQTWEIAIAETGKLLKKERDDEDEGENADDDGDDDDGDHADDGDEDDDDGEHGDDDDDDDGEDDDD